MTDEITQHSCDTLVDASSPFLDQRRTLDDVETLVDAPPPEEALPANADGKAASDTDDDAEWVLSSELIEPLMASDMVDLDYDEDVPTRVDASPRRVRQESLPPARIDTQDVFYLSGRKRPSLVLVDEERVDMAEVVRAEPRIPKVDLPNVVAPPVRESVPPSLHAREMSSIAPMAIPSETPTASRPTTGKQHPRYGATIVALAAVAAAIALWPSGSTSAPVNTHARPTVTEQGQAERTRAPSEAKVHQLDVVSIVGATGAEAPIPGTTRPAWKPSQEVVIDDAAQLTGEVVFPSDPALEVAAPATEPAVAEPAAKETPSPFDPSAAASAMSAAASAAQSCREPGVPRWPARVSVTFAPAGRVTTATVDGSQISGTAVGSCIARKFRTAQVKPFDGAPVTVHKTFLF